MGQPHVWKFLSCVAPIRTLNQNNSKDAEEKDEELMTGTTQLTTFANQFGSLRNKASAAHEIIIKHHQMLKYI